MADFNAMAAFMKGSRPAGIHSDLDAETNARAGGHAGADPQQSGGAAEEQARQLFDAIDTDSDGASWQSAAQPCAVVLRPGVHHFPRPAPPPRIQPASALTARPACPSPRAGTISKFELIDYCTSNGVANVAKLLTKLGLSESYMVPREVFLAKHAAGELALLDGTLDAVRIVRQNSACGPIATGGGTLDAKYEEKVAKSLAQIAVEEPFRRTTRTASRVPSSRASSPAACLPRKTSRGTM